jgi:hypothetical protein
MTRSVVHSFPSINLAVADLYLALAAGDELLAAMRLAQERSELDGSAAGPDDIEVHHALLLLRRARGLPAPSFDTMRVDLRTKLAV